MILVFLIDILGVSKDTIRDCVSVVVENGWSNLTPVSLAGNIASMCLKKAFEIYGVAWRNVCDKSLAHDIAWQNFAAYFILWWQ